MENQASHHYTDPGHVAAAFERAARRKKKAKWRKILGRVLDAVSDILDGFHGGGD